MKDYVFRQCPIGQKMRLKNLYVPFYIIAELNNGKSTLPKIKSSLKFLSPKSVTESLDAAVKSGYVIKEGKYFQLSQSGEQLFQSLRNIAKESKICHECAGRKICLGF